MPWSSPAKGRSGRLLRLAESVGAAHRLPCDARPHGPSPNSLRSLRSLRSNNGDESDLWMRAARAAMSPALLSASDALRSRPERPFAAPPSHFRRRPAATPCFDRLLALRLFDATEVDAVCRRAHQDLVDANVRGLLGHPADRAPHVLRLQHARALL